MASYTEFRARIDRRKDGISLMAYLCQCIPQQSIDEWYALLSKGRIFINGEVASDDVTLRLGQSVSYQIAGYQEPDVPMDWSILWENDELLAVHKPAGLPVSRTTRNINNNLITLIQDDSAWPDAHLLHRLDKETSGIVLIGKTKAAAQKWQPQLKTLMTRKVYHAIVHGTPDWEQVTVSCRLAVRQDLPIRCQMHVCREGEKGQESRGYFKVLKRFNHYSLIECELDTGRKHQIRAHLAHLGHPIIGDKIYAHEGRFFLKRCDDELNEQDLEVLGSANHLLHAYGVSLGLGEGVNKEIVDPNFAGVWGDYLSGL